MKFVALVSGGKDSIFAILEAQKQGHELVACVHLGRPVAQQGGADDDDNEKEEEESYMYQTAGSEVVQTLVQECIQVPLIHYVRRGKSVQTSLVYESSNGSNGKEALDGADCTDEVEDLYRALQQAVKEFPQVQAVASGALLSTYQRVRIENVCQRLGLTSLSYLWRMGTQHDLLRNMREAGLEVVLVRTAAPPGLLPRRHLNQSLVVLQDLLFRLYERYRMHVCGEGGEYESLCLYAPGLYRKRLVLDDVQVHLDDQDDGVGDLEIKTWHTEEVSAEERAHWQVETPSTEVSQPHKCGDKSATPLLVPKELPWTPPHIQWLPRINRVPGGLWHTSSIVSPVVYPSDAVNTQSDADLAVHEARDILSILQALLKSQECTAQDVGMVHLYLADISHFARINRYYRECFGVLLPPSRSCVALGNLPSGRRVMLDCWVLAGSGEYMRRHGGNTQAISPYAEAALVQKAIKYRQVLHVQSLSHWAPVCVGPYSQVNSLLGALHFLAGSIGLWPATMKLRDSWTLQLEQSWKNLARIADALDQSSLSNHLLSGMIYVSDQVYSQNPDETLRVIRSKSYSQMSTNASVVPGLVDDVLLTKHQDSYEDEETRTELEEDQIEAPEDSSLLCPLLVVAIPSMPMGAQVEVEIVTATRAAADCLPISDTRGILERTAGKTDLSAWDAGYDFEGWPSKTSPQDWKIRWSLRALGATGAGFATVVAHSGDALTRATALVSSDILESMTRALQNAINASSSTADMRSLLQVRLYYVSLYIAEEPPVIIDVASQLESAFFSVLPPGVQPAVTVVPVHGMEYVEEGLERIKVALALQATFLNPVKIQTELWIRQGRPAES
jgi:diphthine-ammonia ligase